MHEKALYRDLRRRLTEATTLGPAERIVRVNLWVGALSHVTEPGLRAAWPELARGTSAEGSGLEVVVSDDPADPRAQSVVLSSFVLRTPEGSA
jgi:Zn finger protein HypA/HybF involved in hydrogenase expression